MTSKDYIMKSPQTKNGFTQIANELLEAIMKIRISGEARQVFDTIMRKTYGYQKKEDVISLSQFTESTTLSKTSICKAINKLLAMRLITKKVNVTKKGNGKTVTYSIIKDYDKWKPLPKKEINATCYPKRKSVLPKKEISYYPKRKQSLPKSRNTKEKRKRDTKETLTKEKEINSSLSLAVAKTKKIPDSDHHKIIKYWTDEYMKKFGVEYNFQQGKDGSIIKRLLKTFKLEGLKLIMDTLLASNDEFYRKRGGYTIGVLSANSNKLAQQAIPDNNVLNKFSTNAQKTIVNMRNILERDKQNGII